MEMVHTVSPATGWSKSTIVTMVGRLEAKGAVAYTEGRKARLAQQGGHGNQHRGGQDNIPDQPESTPPQNTTQVRQMGGVQGAAVEIDGRAVEAEQAGGGQVLHQIDRQSARFASGGVQMIVPSRTSLLRASTSMTAGKRNMKERIALIVQRPRMLKATAILTLLVMCSAVAVTFGAQAAALTEIPPEPPPEEASQPLVA